MLVVFEVEKVLRNQKTELQDDFDSEKMEMISTGTEENEAIIANEKSTENAVSSHLSLMKILKQASFRFLTVFLLTSQLFVSFPFTGSSSLWYCSWPPLFTVLFHLTFCSFHSL
jgi:hypothetical protein